MPCYQLGPAWSISFARLALGSAMSDRVALTAFKAAELLKTIEPFIDAPLSAVLQPLAQALAQLTDKRWQHQQPRGVHVRFSVAVSATKDATLTAQISQILIWAGAACSACNSLVCISKLLANC